MSGSGVSFGMQSEVVAASERSATELTLERPVSGVLAVVTRQLVGPREPPRAVRPLAPVRLVARVRAQVRLQVRALAVGLAARRERAPVRRRRRRRRRLPPRAAAGVRHLPSPPLPAIGDRAARSLRWRVLSLRTGLRLGRDRGGWRMKVGRALCSSDGERGRRRTDGAWTTSVAAELQLSSVSLRRLNSRARQRWRTRWEKRTSVDRRWLVTVSA